MPVFHTKTIESILEPVAQQVSRLVILHEEAEDGNAMPDLGQPVMTVKTAVENLVRVGYDTCNSSDDQILKQDMPPCLNRVDEASLFLLQASDMLRADPFSAAARKKLIEGSRGILQGTSQLLFCFDESEVRKIIRTCKGVLEYLAITEVVDSMEDLVTFVKNLSPVLTNMTKLVDGREKELTHQVHRMMLIRSLDEVKNLTPVLISAVKMFITAKHTNAGAPEAQSNRDYIVRKMSDEVQEIIRVLQLTTYDEDEWDADDVTVMKKSVNAIEQKMKPAFDWLADPAALVGSSGDKALSQILEDARKVAERCTDPADRDRILKTVGDIDSMKNALSELRVQGKGSSPQAMSLAREIQNKLKDLQNLTQAGTMKTERSGIRKPAPTVEGKVEQARQWLANPALDDRGLGEQATKLVVAEGRKVADSCTGPQRSELLRLCDETEILTNQLSDLIRRGQGDSPQAKAIARQLTEKLHNLQAKIQEALVNQVAEDFIDITGPLKQLHDAALTPLGVPGREEKFDDRARNFESHASKLADTANMVATAGGCNNKHTVQEIFKTSNQVNDLTPQVITAARVLFANPNNQAAIEHFDQMKNRWAGNVERLRALVDEAVDTPALIKAEEEGILRDTDRVEEGIRGKDPPKIVANASNIARRAYRVLQVGEKEVENSEDPAYIDRVRDSANTLRDTITPMVQHAKNLSMNPGDSNAATNWRKANQALINGVAGVRDAVTVSRGEDMFPPPPPPDLSQLNINDGITGTARRTISPISISVPDQFADSHYTMVAPEATMRQEKGYQGQHAAPPVPPPPVPPPPRDPYYGYYDDGDIPPRPPLPHETAPARPPPPDTDDEEDFPVPQANQPIMMAAHALHMETKQWSSKDNEIIAAAKRMALLMAKLSQLVRGEGGSKKDLIATAKNIAESSTEVAKLAQKLAAECTDKRMRTNLLQVCERIPTIGTQLKILSTVKATMLGAQEPVPAPDGGEISCGSEEDQEATEMLVGNAQNLMQAVKETVRAAEAASIKIRVDSGYQIRWHRRRPWYTTTS
ncbi:vinculin-like isoform X1 [Mytilus californianus]|uniref:vinculin-like isoform X1 n=1 Tax=Mytilus californianus TaxID=6549 RepID=UPI0022452280|nr:vinculin-like isoform X1 [Mytilus californianus]